MTCWPMRVLIQVWHTPSAAVTAATATIPATSRASSVRLRSGSAVSTTARSRNGDARPTSEDATIVTVTSSNRHRYAANSPATRPSETVLACALSSAVSERGSR